MDVDDLYERYEDNGSNCCGAKIIGEAWCADCHEACETFEDFIASYADAVSAMQEDNYREG